MTSWSRRKTTPRSETEIVRAPGQPSPQDSGAPYGFLERLTRDSKVPYHIITPFEQVSHLKAFVLPAYDRSHILMREIVQRARVSQWFEQARTSLRVATKKVAVKLLLTRG